MRLHARECDPAGALLDLDDPHGGPARPPTPGEFSGGLVGVGGAVDTDEQARRGPAAEGTPSSDSHGAVRARRHTWRHAGEIWRLDVRAALRADEDQVRAPPLCS